VLTIVLMAVFVAVNFLAMRIFARVNNTLTWWKIAVPVLAIIVLATQWHGGNFTADGGFIPGGVKALFGALPAAGIIFAYGGFEQSDQLAGEIKDPGRNLPRAIIYSILIGTAIYVLLQVMFIAAMPPHEVAHGFANIANKDILNGPFAGLAAVAGLGWLATILRIDAFISPSGTGLIYTTATSRISYGLSRNRYYPQIFGKVDRRGVPWVGLIFAFIIGLFFLLPFPSWHSLVGLITGASGARPGRIRRRQPAHLLVGLRGDLEARHRLDPRLPHHGDLHGLRPAAAAAGLEVRGMASGVADRPGHHLLAGPVQRGRVERQAPAAAD
jgi:amino acid transporter